MRLYETTFILSPDLEEADLEKNIQRYTKIITEHGGKIEKEERWGMRRLAYEINRKTQGFYVHMVHNSAPPTPSELERQFLLNEHCLRYLTVVAPKPAPVTEPKAKESNQKRKGATSSSDSHEPATEQKPAPAAAETDTRSDADQQDTPAEAGTESKNE